MKDPRTSYLILSYSTGHFALYELTINYFFLSLTVSRINWGNIHFNISFPLPKNFLVISLREQTKQYNT